MLWAVGAVLLAIAHLALVVPRLPPPAPEPDESPPDYRRLVGPVGYLTVGICAAGGWLLVSPSAPLIPLWLAYLGGGSALVYVDLRTTYLPRRLHWLVAAQVGAAVVILAASQPAAALSVALGGAAAYGLLWLAWRLGRSLGFGDVRLASLVGALGATMGLNGWLWSLLAGSLAGLGFALVHAIRRARTTLPAHFAYGPALWLGPILTAAVSGW